MHTWEDLGLCIIRSSFATVVFVITFKACFVAFRLLLWCVFFDIFCSRYRVSRELRSLLRDLIPELILSQKCHIHMGPIHNGSGVTSFYRHHHHISVMELGHLLTRSGHTYPEVSSKVCHDSFCQLGNSVSLPWVYCHFIPS